MDGWSQYQSKSGSKFIIAEQVKAGSKCFVGDFHTPLYR